MMDYEAFIKLEDDINKRPVTFTGTQAEWEALTTSQKAFYETINITDDVQSGQATLNGVVLAGDKTSHQVGVAAESNQGTVESYSTAQNAHEEGTWFVNSLGEFVEATENISIGDTISSSNTESKTIATILKELDDKIDEGGGGGGGGSLKELASVTADGNMTYANIMVSLYNQLDDTSTDTLYKTFMVNGYLSQVCKITTLNSSVLSYSDAVCDSSNSLYYFQYYVNLRNSTPTGIVKRIGGNSTISYTDLSTTKPSSGSIFKIIQFGGGSGGSGSVYPNAGSHSSIYRGKSLGSSVTSDQYDAINAGTFDDLFIGDYWTINDVNYRIAAFDYWLHTGDTECTTHHVVIVPDTNLYLAKMNDTSTTSGGYVGSQMYTTNLADARTAINTAFGSSHILTHREYLIKTVSNGKPSEGDWYDSTVDLMNEQMVYGGFIFEPASDGATIPKKQTIDRSQLPLFSLDPSKIFYNRLGFWLRSVISSSAFACIDGHGNATTSGAIGARGVRPAFGICKANPS